MIIMAGVAVFVLLFLKQYIINRIHTDKFISLSALHGIVTACIVLFFGYWTIFLPKLVYVIIFSGITDFIVNVMMSIDFKNNLMKKYSIYIDFVLVVILYSCISYLIAICI